jgi:hypothetical protein
MTPFLTERSQLLEFVWNRLLMWRVDYRDITLPYFEPASFGGAACVYLLQATSKIVSFIFTFMSKIAAPPPGFSIC